MSKIRDPRLGYKTHREKSSEETDSGATIETFKHFDGSVDKTVKVKSLVLNLFGKISPEHMKAINELQEASRQMIIAKHSNNPEMERKATFRLERANVRLLEVQ